MKDFYATYNSDELWLIKETTWARRLQTIRESQFALGNGYLGARGNLEDMPQGVSPGFYIAGLYDKMGSQVDELVNLPNPLNFKFTVEGHKLDVVAMDVVHHKRVLNMKKGLLTRRNLYKDRKKRRYSYQSLRLLSMKNKHLGAMQIVLNALDEDCAIDVDTGIDMSVSNAPILSEGSKRHFRVRELGQRDKAGYLAIETLEKKHIIIYWSGFYYEVDGKKIFAKDNIFKLRLKKDKPVVFTKIFYIQHFPHKSTHSRVRARIEKSFRKYFYGNFSDILKEHIFVWGRMWKKSDILIRETANLQQNLRFNIYHMLICGHRDNGFSSIGARSLSGEGYRGHIFWDSEIFLFPFYLFTYPQLAKDILIYRYRRLDKSRELAAREGYKGAKFAWESASTGEEETPEWARDIDGKITRVHTHQFEHHITADIAYAFYKYYVVTKDEKFLRNYGYEVMFETARFWASRVKYNKRTKKYEILSVIGPDEFHVNVNNNAFTNIMAKWNIITAHKLYKGIKENSKLYKELHSKLSLSKQEVAEWRRIASNISVNIGKNNVIEQFDNYFKLKKVTLTRTDENGMPIIPMVWRSKDFEKTQLVKQADVLMLLYLLDDVYNEKTKQANYKYYMPRTVHGSSLSPSIHSICASDAGDMQRAYSLFNVALRMDISNLFDNTKEGIHAASLGGAWQAVVFGFAGVRIKKEKLSINPSIPGSWGEVVFTIMFQNRHIYLRITDECVKIKMIASQNKSMDVTIFNEPRNIKQGKWFTFTKSESRRRLARFY
ncbi:MAG: glycosyl hydrolase family 65 protein [Candidatus Omnitrophota bacterium]